MCCSQEPPQKKEIERRENQRTKKEEKAFYTSVRRIRHTRQEQPDLSQGASFSYFTRWKQRRDHCPQLGVLFWSRPINPKTYIPGIIPNEIIQQKRNKPHASTTPPWPAHSRARSTQRPWSESRSPITGNSSRHRSRAQGCSKGHHDGHCDTGAIRAARDDGQRHQGGCWGGFGVGQGWIVFRRGYGREWLSKADGR